MTELFESAWMDKNFRYHKRVSNGKISYEKDIDGRHEYFTPDSKGIYTSLVHSDVRFSKNLGKSADARDKEGHCQPIYRNIRDEHWDTKTFNKNPRIWFLDIETRSGVLYKNEPSDKQHELVNTVTNEKFYLSEKEIQQKLLKESINNYEINGILCGKIDFLDRTRSFPIPSLAEHEVTLIQFYDNIENVLYMLGLRDFNIQDVYDLGYKLDVEVKYYNCKNEVTLLNAFLKIFNKLDPLLILGWNTEGFDYPYLYNRLKKLGLGELSNYGGSELEETNDSLGRVKYSLKSNGHFFMDLMDIYKKFTFAPRSSYSLDNIAKEELNDQKIPHTEFLTFDSFYTGENYSYTDEPYTDKLRELIRTSYKTDKEKFLKYVNMQFMFYGAYDVILMVKLNDKLKFTSLMLMISEMMGVQLSDVLRTVKPWSQYISNVALKENKIVPRREEHETPNIIGGFVRDPKVGLNKFVLNADVNSMYPLLSIAAFNMSPETYLKTHELPSEVKDIVLSITNEQDEDRLINTPKERLTVLHDILEKNKLGMSINGSIFKQDHQGIIPRLVTQIYKTRKESKKLMIKYYNQANTIKDILHKRGIEV